MPLSSEISEESDQTASTIVLSRSTLFESDESDQTASTIVLSRSTLFASLSVSFELIIRSVKPNFIMVS